MSDKLKLWSTIIGLIMGVIGLVTFLMGGASAVTRWFGSMGEVDLPATYASETWRQAKPEDSAWLATSWCYPTLGDFQSSFRLEGGQMQRRNTSSLGPVDTGWINVTIYKSNRDVLRVWHDDDTMPGSYLRPATPDNLSLYENERRSNDAGDISDTNQILALDCNRCAISPDGLTYDCN